MLLGDFNIWLYEFLAGIRPDKDQPGFKHIVMKPELLGDLDYVKASHRSIYGMIRSHWQRHNGVFKWDITIPANTTAVVYVPTKGTSLVTESGVAADKATGVQYMGTDAGRAIFMVGSGEYHFESKL